MPSATDEYYHALGRMICRAAEAEVMLEALAADLYPEKADGWFAGRNTSAVANEIVQAADRWPNQAVHIRELAAAMQDTADVRNWLVHAWVLSSQDGEWVELQKPVRGAQRWGRRRIFVGEVDVLSARFVWVLRAVVRVESEHDWEMDGQPSAYVEAWQGPPPLPGFVGLPEPSRPIRSTSE